MIERDYIVKKSQAKKNNSRVMSPIMFVITAILIILLIAILFFVMRNGKEKPVEEPKAKTELPEIVLPEQPQERWTYLKELETPNIASPEPTKNSSQNSTKSPPVPTSLDSMISQHAAEEPAYHSAPETESQLQSDRQWILQCGAFKEKNNAEGLRAKLALVGVISSIEEGKLYLVMVGPYDTKEEANRMVDTLKNSDINSCVIYNK